MEATWYLKTVFIVILIGIVISIWLYIWNREFYLQHRVAIRKIYYGVIILSAFCLWSFGEFPDAGENIQHLIALVISVVIIDLFVFQTPDITKFMSNELKQESLVKSLDNNRDTLVGLGDKLILVNRMMPKNIDDWYLEGFTFTQEKYEEIVLMYLRRFASENQFDVYSYMVKSDPDEEKFKENIAEVYEKIKKDHNLTIRGVGMRKKHVIKTLLEGKNIEIYEYEHTSVLFPYFGEYYNMIFIASSRQKAAVTGADASLMLNLLYTFDLWLQANIVLLTEDETDSEDEFEQNHEIDMEVKRDI